MIHLELQNLLLVKQLIKYQPLCINSICTIYIMLINEYVAGDHGGQRGSWAPLHQLQPSLVCTRRPLRGLHISLLRGQEAFCSDFSRI